MEFSRAIVDRILEMHETAKVEAQRLQHEADQSARIEKIWADCRKYVVQGWSLHFISLLEREAALFKQTKIPALKAGILLVLFLFFLLVGFAGFGRTSPCAVTLFGVGTTFDFLKKAERHFFFGKVNIGFLFFSQKWPK